MNKHIPLIDPSQTLLIGLGNKARHGKDFVAKSIVKHFGTLLGVRHYGFADALKDELRGREREVAEQYGLPELLDDNPDMSDPLCPFGKHPRLLQFWGEKRREEDALCWVRATALRIFSQNPHVALISDVRRVYEAAWIKASGGYMVQVVRPNFVDPVRPADHITEVDLDDYQKWDFSIINDFGLESLERDAVSVFSAIMADRPEVTDLDFSVSAFGADND